MQVPQDHQDHGQHGRGRSRRGQEGHGRRGRRPHQDHRPEAAGHASRASRSRPSRCATAWPIGCKVTLRGARMYEFLDRLVSIAMPRIRDFRGVSRALVRRPRQLQLRRQGTDHFPGDRLRPDRRDPRHGHHDHDDGARRQSRDARCSKLSTSRSASRAKRMAKTSMVKREKRRAKLVKRTPPGARSSRKSIRKPDEHAGGARGRGRGSCRRCRATRARVRQRNRCAITGRSRGELPQVRPGRAPSCAKRRCAATFRASARPAGKAGPLEHDMSMTDPIADFLTRIRNGQSSGKTEVNVPASQGEAGDCQGAEGRRLHRRFRRRRDARASRR